MAVVAGRDARGLLAAVLQRVQGEVGEAGDVGLRRVDAEHAALVARSVAELDAGSIGCHEKQLGEARSWNAASRLLDRHCRA